jgi:transcriptional regulator with XRE-family HTH domain
MLADIGCAAVTTDNRGAAALRKVLETTKQVELASKTGISQSHISRLASGEKTPKRLADAQALLEYAGIGLGWWEERIPTARSKARAAE